MLSSVPSNYSQHSPRGPPSLRPPFLSVTAAKNTCKSGGRYLQLSLRAASGGSAQSFSRAVFRRSQVEREDKQWPTWSVLLIEMSREVTPPSTSDAVRGLDSLSERPTEVATSTTGGTRRSRQQLYRAHLDNTITFRDDHYAFNVVVSCPNGDLIQVHRRYREFYNLDRLLRDDIRRKRIEVDAGVLPQLPGKKVLSRLVAPKQSLAMGRIDPLNEYLQGVLKCPELTMSRHVSSFLEDGARARQGVIASPSASRRRSPHFDQESCQSESDLLSFLVVGERSSGKTCLVDRIAKGKFNPHTPARRNGREADVQAIQLSTMTGSDINVSFIDLHGLLGVCPDYLPENLLSAGIFLCIPLETAFKTPDVLKQWLEMTAKATSRASINARTPRDSPFAATYHSDGVWSHSSEDDEGPSSNRRASLTEADSHVSSSSEKQGKLIRVPCLVLLTKCDTAKEAFKRYSEASLRQMEHEVKRLCKSYGAKSHIKVSAKTGQNLETALGLLVGLVLTRLGRRDKDLEDAPIGSPRQRKLGCVPCTR